MGKLVLFLVFAYFQLSASLWPQPQQLTSTGTRFNIDQSQFSFSSDPANNFILNQAFIRYGSLLFLASGPLNPPTLPLVTSLYVKVTSPDRPLGPNTSEKYTLQIAVPTSTLTADTEYGALRGLETFSQLVSFQNGQFVLPQVTINDFPRFSYRSVLVDTSRHFVPLPVIFQFLDAMAYNKFNVLHWHIVDDQSFPWVSTTFPNLATKGAFPPYDSHIYKPTDVQGVILYGRLRGIRVIPEFDTPAHAASWTRGYPQLATQCYHDNKPYNNPFPPLNPIAPTTYDFLSKLFYEVGNVFPDNYIHLGGDELDYSCWESNPDITAFMQQMGWTGKYNLLETYYEQKVVDIVKQLGKRYVVWEDVFDNNVTLDANTIIAVWRGEWQETMNKVTKAGFQTVLYSPWYLNYISYGSDWRNYYNVEPLNWNGTPEQQSKVIGGSCTFWGEYIDGSNLVSRAWPRSSAVGERLWSAKSVTNITDAAERLEAWRCVMIQRGIPAEPAEVAVPCPQEWKLIYTPPWEE